MASFNCSYHRIQKGDTNGSVATRYRMDIEHFRAKNPAGPQRGNAGNVMTVVARKDRACGRSCIAVQGNKPWVRCQCTLNPKKYRGAHAQASPPVYVDATPYHSAYDGDDASSEGEADVDRAYAARCERDCFPTPTLLTGELPNMCARATPREDRLEQYFEERACFPEPTLLTASSTDEYLSVSDPFQGSGRFVSPEPACL